MPRYRWLKASLSTTLFFSLSLLPNLATGQIIHSQTVEVDYNIDGDGLPAQLTFEPFYTILGSRELDKVTLKFDGVVDLEVVAQNLSESAFEADDWYLDAGANVIVAFKEKPGYEDGGPFWGLGGVFKSGITGALSPGSGGPPIGLPPPTPGEVDVNATISEQINSTVSSTEGLEYYISAGAPLRAQTSPFLDYIFTPPVDDPFAFLDAKTLQLSQTGTVTLIYQSTNKYPCAGDKLAADVGGDGSVAFPDFLALSRGFGKPGEYQNGDITCDGFVGFDDFLIFADFFKNGDQAIEEFVASKAFEVPSNPELAAVPEPGTHLMLLIGAMLVLRFTRRRV